MHTHLYLLLYLSAYVCSILLFYYYNATNSLSSIQCKIHFTLSSFRIYNFILSWWEIWLLLFIIHFVTCSTLVYTKSSSRIANPYPHRKSMCRQFFCLSPYSFKSKHRYPKVLKSASFFSNPISVGISAALKGGYFVPRAHMAISGDISDCYNWGGSTDT